MSKENKEEFYVTISPEQYSRKGPDFFVGTVIKTGKEVSIRLLDQDELKENGFNPINRGAYKRPEIEDMLEGEGSGKKANKILKKFEMLSQDAMKAMPNVSAPDNLVLKINTSMNLTEGWIGTRWIDILTGEGSEPFSMDNDIAVSANGLGDTGMYINIVRPNKFKDPANLFVEVIDAKSAVNSSTENFSKDLIEAVDESIKFNAMGGMSMVHVMCLDENNRAVKFNFSYQMRGETKEYSSTQFSVRTSANEGGKWKNFNSGKEAVAYALKTDNGKVIDQYLLDHPKSKIAIVPAGSFIIGPNVKNAMINDSKQKERLTDLRFNPYEIDFGGKYPIKSYNKGQFSVRQGEKNKKSYYVTDVTTTDPFNKPISLLDVAKYTVGATKDLKDNEKTEKPDSPNDNNEHGQQKAITRKAFR